jgi:hypothetical protein
MRTGVLTINSHNRLWGILAGFTLKAILEGNGAVGGALLPHYGTGDIRLRYIFLETNTVVIISVACCEILPSLVHCEAGT